MVVTFAYYLPSGDNSSEFWLWHVETSINKQAFWSCFLYWSKGPCFNMTCDQNLYGKMYFKDLVMHWMVFLFLETYFFFLSSSDFVFQKCKINWIFVTSKLICAKSISVIGGKNEERKFCSNSFPRLFSRTHRNWQLIRGF